MRVPAHPSDFINDTEQGLKIISKRLPCMAQICATPGNSLPTAQDTRVNRLHCLYPYGYLAETSMCPVSYLHGTGNLLRIINRPG
ncbi:hypothetical protein C0Q70_01747 [Pomacea canaliculata]|uniref:Uncharacterized protein n=1 Tax=Pomacea canaliculata TaxID=400727 RepID=A0A2T7Q0C8_POMCA|nr:hypothetical protein C0Q70_01747 [Pomacea canaliculata]